jgi:hypothetical protein
LNRVHYAGETSGPSALDRLDRLALRIRELDALEFLNFGGTISQVTERLIEQVWAPYRFASNQNVHKDGRESEASAVHVGEETLFFLELVLPPSGMDARKWNQECGPMLRFWLECESAGRGKWTRVCEIDTASESGTVEVH